MYSHTLVTNHEFFHNCKMYVYNSVGVTWRWLMWDRDHSKITSRSRGRGSLIAQCDNREGESTIALCHTCHLYSACYHVVLFCLLCWIGQTYVHSWYTFPAAGSTSQPASRLSPSKLHTLLQQAEALRNPETLVRAAIPAVWPWATGWRPEEDI